MIVNNQSETRDQGMFLARIKSCLESENPTHSQCPYSS